MRIVEQLRHFISLMLPCERTEVEEAVGRGEVPSPDPPNDGTVPIGGAPPDGSSPAPEAIPEGTPPAAEAQADLELAQRLEAANARITELDARDAEREGRIDQLAEERLIQVMPDLPQSLEDERLRRAQAQAPQPQQPDLDEPTEETLETRLDRLENQQHLDRRSVEADRILDQVETLHQTKYPHMDVQKTLMILARGRAEGREYNVERMCEVSHRVIGRGHEEYHQARLNDPNHLKEIVDKAQRTVGTGGPAAPPALGQREAQGAPAPTIAPEKATSATATSTLIERLKQVRWGGGGETVGPPMNK